MEITNIPTAKYHAKTLAGLEQLVADELLAHGQQKLKWVGEGSALQRLRK